MNKISIITVNRNNAEGLERTIKSVIAQSYQNVEFIIIDGASTDNSVDIIKRYDKYITYWVSEPDNGIFNAMNKGIRQASGDYCYFLNSADELFSADTLFQIFSERHFNAPFISGHQVNNYGSDRWIVKSPNCRLTVYYFYAGTLKHQATFIRRDLFDIYGMYDESLKITSDWKFFLEVIALHDQQPVYVDVNVVLFEWNGISTSEEYLKVHMDEKSRVLEQYLPASVLEDYKHLHDLCQFEDVAQTMKEDYFLYKLMKAWMKTKIWYRSRKS